MIASTALKASDIQKEFLSPTVGYFNVIVEVSLFEMRYMIVSQTEIWRYQVNKAEHWTGWRQRMKSFTGAIESPHIEDLIDTFGYVVQSERIELDAAQITEQFEIEFKQFLSYITTRYGDLNLILPVGSLFKWGKVEAVLTYTKPENTVILPVYSDKSLPVNHELLGRAINKADDYTPYLKKDYYCNVIELNDDDGLSARRFYIAGPSYYKYAPSQKTSEGERTSPYKKWRVPLWILPNTNTFNISIDAARPESDDEDDFTPIARSEWIRTGNEAPVIELSFQPGLDQPDVKVLNATLSKDQGIESNIDPIDTIDFYRGKTIRTERKITAQVVFLLDGYAPNLAFIIDELLIPATRYAFDKIDPNTRFQLCLYNDYPQDSQSVPLSYKTRFSNIKPASDRDKWMEASTFLSMLDPDEQEKYGIEWKRRPEKYLGALEKALFQINQVQWDEGNRILVSIGMGGPYEKDKIPSPNDRVSWQNELAILKENDTKSLAFFTNDTVEGVDSTPLMEQAAYAWERLGYTSFHTRFAFYVSRHLEDIDDALEDIYDFFLDYASPKIRYDFNTNVPWPLYEPYWLSDERGNHEFSESTPDYEDDFDGDEEI